MPDTQHHTKQSLSYAKLVATPTETAWSQAYNAGNLFGCLSLSRAEAAEGQSLPVIGKAILSNLEAEFFTLEEKTLTSIQKALAESIKQIPEDVTVSFCLAFFKESVLYLFIAGKGKILIKRGATIGTLLEKDATSQEKILTASGRIQHTDCLLLQTDQFAEKIDHETITQAFDLSLPNDIAETLSPKLHATDDGAQAAVIIVVQGGMHAAPLAQETFEEDTLGQAIQQEEEQQTEIYEREETPEKKSFKLPFPKHFPALPFQFKQNMPHTRKLFLSITLIIVVLLIASIVFTKQQQDNERTQKRFAAVYPQAERYYEEGKAIETLNPELSQEDFTKAEALLQKNHNDFRKGSDEEKQIAALLAKVQAELSGEETTEKVTPAETAQIKEADDNSSAYLSIEKDTQANSFAQDGTTVFAVTDDAILSLTKSDAEEKELIANEDSWNNAVALSPYQGNIYVLDTGKGVVKYVAGAGGFGKTDYFKGIAPNLKNAVAMAIDSSIWILTVDGKILKYTSGKADSFQIKALEKPLNKPAKIFTDKDTESVYILDKGNKRIVVLSKEGAFQKQYAAEIIGQAKDFDVQEADKRIIILSKNKLWEISL